MAELYSRYLAKLYEPAYISQGSNFSGVDISTFQKKSGSRMQLAVSIHTLSPGATVNVTLENAATLINPVFATALNKNYTAVGIETEIILDLNRYCTLTVNVTNGSATYSIVVTLVDNASSEGFATEATLEEIATLLTNIDSKSTKAFSSGANTRPAISETSAQVLASNNDRKFAYIWNRTGVTVSLSFISPAVAGQQIRLANNDVYEINNDNLWTGAIFAVRDSGTGTLNLEIFEGV